MTKKKFDLIAAACENMGMGFKGQLPWRLREELKYFNRMTTKVTDNTKKNVVIMGRKTYFGIPEKERPLLDRINVVLTRNPIPDVYPKDVIVCTSLSEALKKLEEPQLAQIIDRIWICGGNSIYKEAMESNDCDKIYFTSIKAKFECDTFFPEITKDFKLIDNDEDIPSDIQEENGVQYQYMVYKKN